MALKFNPFTGTFDFTGSGGGGGASYIDGEVATYADLPLDGSAALNTAWLVRQASGTWLIARKPAGIYIRTATAGVSRDADWTYAGILPDVFNDANFLLYDNADSSKNLAFQLSSITTGTTRTLTVPDASGRIQIEGQAIGNTTPAAGTFTTLSANNGTLTASAPVLDLSQTWNNSAVAFTTFRINVTNTASLFGGSTSNLQDWLVGGTSVASLNAAGFISCRGLGTVTGGPITVNGCYGLHGPAGGVMEVRQGTTPIEARFYNTFTSATNHERGFLKWSSNVFQIGTEKGSGGGSARALEFQTDGVRRGGFGSDGNFSVVGNISASSFVRANSFECNTGNTGISFGDGFTFLRGPATAGVLNLTAFNNTDVLFRLGGTSSSWPALNSSGSTLRVRLADNSGFAPLSCGALTLNGNLDASTRDIVTDTTTGTKIGTGTTQRIGFFNATPAVQPAAVADATDAASTQARLNDLLARLRTLGLIAT